MEIHDKQKKERGNPSLLSTDFYAIDIMPNALGRNYLHSVRYC